MYYYIIVTFIYMRNTRYSVGPKFFGTTAKSNSTFRQSLGSMKAIAVHLDLELTKLS